MTVAIARDLELALSAPGCPMHRARPLCIDSLQEAVVYPHRESEVCRFRGFAAMVFAPNTISHPSKAIGVQGLLADAVSPRLRPCHAT
jgi:hypothetical protein